MMIETNNHDDMHRILKQGWGFRENGTLVTMVYERISPGQDKKEKG